MAGLSQKWQDYRPTKGVWVWSCVACIALTMILGFTVGGWVTGGTAATMERQSAVDARQSLVASLCVNNFVSSPQASSALAKLKEASSWEQDDFIEEGGWASIAGLKEQVSGAADACADRLAEMESIPEVASDSTANQG